MVIHIVSSVLTIVTDASFLIIWKILTMSASKRIFYQVHVADNAQPQLDKEPMLLAATHVPPWLGFLRAGPN